MPSLRQASRARGDSGQRLPDVFRSFAEAGIHLRRGHVTLVAAAPGVGKSVIGLVHSLRMGVPTHYLAMDADEHTTCVRVVQHCALIDSKEAERQVTEDGKLARDALDAVDWIRFDFPSSPDIEEIVHRVWAFGELHGEWPHFIVVDNLMDVAFDGDENSGINGVMEDLSKLARATKAAVLVLHHVTGGYEDGNETIPLSGLRNKVGKKPALVLTINNGAADEQVWVSVVKNRFGRADPAGIRMRVPLRTGYAQMQMYEWGAT